MIRRALGLSIQRYLSGMIWGHGRLNPLAPPPGAEGVNSRSVVWTPLKVSNDLLNNIVL
jgi:hypothetical protein